MVYREKASLVEGSYFACKNIGFSTILRVCVGSPPPPPQPATYGVKKARLDMVNIFTKNKYNSILGLFPCGFYQFLHLTVVIVLTIMAQQRKITPLVTVNTFSFSSVFVE